MKRTTLTKALRLAQPALADKEYVPSFVCFGFNSSVVQAYNDAIGIRVVCKLGIDGAIEGQRLTSLLFNANSKQVKYEQVDNSIKIVAGSSEGLFPVLPQDEFLFEFPELDPKIQINGDDDFMEGIKRCLISTTDDEASVLGGITIRIKDGQATLFSSDHKTISKYVLSQSVDGTNISMLPATFCRTLQKMIKLTKLEPTIGFDNNYAVARFGDKVEMFTKLVDDKKIKFNKTINEFLGDFESFIEMPKTFRSAIKQSLGTLEGTKQELCELIVSNSKLTVHTKSDRAEIRRIIKLSDDHDNVSILIEPALIERVLKICDHLRILDKVSVFGDNDRYFYIVRNKYTV